MSGVEADTRYTFGRFLRWTLADRLALPGLGLLLRRANTEAASDLVEEALDYGGREEQRLVTVAPREPDNERPPVFFVHGGSWRRGEPEQFLAIGRFFARLGHPTALVGYRKAPHDVFPAQLDDALAGLRLALETWRAGGSSRGVIIAGQSSGAHIAALAAFDRARADAAGITEHDVGGALLLSGPLDLGLLCPMRPRCPVVVDLMGGLDGWEVADPVRKITGDERFPTLVVHGARDPLVPLPVGASFARRGIESGLDVTFDVQPRAHHMDLIRLFLDGTHATDTVRAWLART